MINPNQSKIIENILIDNEYYPHVCDFGLSRCFPESFEKSMNLTITGGIGTPLYMSPELLKMEEQYDLSVDVYAFAILAYEIVSGKEPYFELVNERNINLLCIRNWRHRLCYNFFITICFKCSSKCHWFVALFIENIDFFCFIKSFFKW